MQTQPLELVFWLSIVFAGLILYILPAIVAIWTQHPRALAISLLTILFGWTVIGWVVFLFWAMNDDYVLQAVSVTKDDKRPPR